MNQEKIAFLKDKLRSWPGEMALTSADIADLLTLLDDPAPPSEGERKEMLDALDYGNPTTDGRWEHCPCRFCKAYRKTRALILAAPVEKKAVSREWVRETCGKLSALARIPMTLEQQIAVSEANESYLKNRLRGLGLAVEAAEEKPLEPPK